MVRAYPEGARMNPTYQGWDLDHHGDRDLGDGLINFAVNIRRSTPPEWLSEFIISRIDRWASYPDPACARHALAQRHGVDEQMILPTSGAAEAFTLIASAIEAHHAAIVHPQFSEPEAAMLRCGREIDHIMSEDFTLHNLDVDDDIDLLFIGNPTNPTGYLHNPADIEALKRPGRIIVIDEAFMDFCPVEYSLISSVMDGVIVIRSLTKIFSIPGIRAGYIVASPDHISSLAAHQSPWSVSSPALDVMVASAEEQARTYIDSVCDEVDRARCDLVERLLSIDAPPVESKAPFLLLNTSFYDESKSIRIRLADEGIAVRRSETFPGLGPQWIRLAVKTPDEHIRLIEALKKVKGVSR